MSQEPAPSLSMRLLEADRVPDWLIRNRIRALLQQRLQEEDKGDPQSQQEHLMAMVRSLRESPIAIHTACLLYTSPSPRDRTRSRMPSSA